MTHGELTQRAERWLRNTLNCRVVLTELVAFTINNETPDAVGWTNGRCILVECKTTRSDFYKDQKKPFRCEGMRSLGDWRFYLTPPDLLSGIELPEGWGWYEVRGKQVKHAGGKRYANAVTPPNQSDGKSEVAMLVSAMARMSR